MLTNTYNIHKMYPIAIGGGGIISSVCTHTHAFVFLHIRMLVFDTHFQRQSLKSKTCREREIRNSELQSIAQERSESNPASQLAPTYVTIAAPAAPGNRPGPTRGHGRPPGARGQSGTRLGPILCIYVYIYVRCTNMHISCIPYCYLADNYIPYWLFA